MHRLDIRLVFIRIAQILLILFPLFWAFLVQIQNLTRLHRADPSFGMTVPLTLTFWGGLLVLSRRPRLTVRRAAIEVGLCIAGLVSIRLLLLTLFSSDASSDFADIHHFAVDLATGLGTANIGKYQSIPQVTYLNMPALLLSLFYRLWGTSLRVGKFVMVVFAGLSGLGIYFSGKNAFHDHNRGISGALLFACLPSLVVYTGITTPEHIAILFITLVFLTLTRLEGLEGHWIWQILAFALLGALAGLVDWFRPVGVILVVAIVIADMLLSKLNSPKKWLQLGARLTLLFIFYAAVSNLSVNISERLFSVRIPANNLRLGEFLYIGLNVQTDGTNNGNESLKKIRDSFGDHYQEANRYLMDLTLARLVQDRARIPSLLVSKFNREWGDHHQLFEFALVGSNDAELAGYLKSIDDLFTPLMFLGVLISTLALLFKPANRAILSMHLFVLGVGCLLLITEAQNRYPVVVLPALVILAADWVAQSAEYLARAAAWLRGRKLPALRR